MTRVNLSDSVIKEFVVPRRSSSRKGDNGVVLVMGGSYVYHGAPILSSIAALRCGADLVYTSVPKVNVTATRAISPALIVIPMADQKLTRGTATKLLGALPRNLHSATIGMGLAIQEKNALLHLVRSLLDKDVRLSLDASALIPEVLPLLADKNVVLTPHAGEFKRLFGIQPPPPFVPSTQSASALADASDAEEERIHLVEQSAKRYAVTVLLKGPTDIISDGSTTYLYKKKMVPAMTVGGTGDVLSGLIAGLLSRSRDAPKSASVAAFVNGNAGWNVQNRLGLHMIATDLLDEIPSVMKQFDQIVE